EQGLEQAGFSLGSPAHDTFSVKFATLFPGGPVAAAEQTPQEYLAGDDRKRSRRRRVTREMILLRLASENRALQPFRPILDDRELAVESPYLRMFTALDRQLAAAPPFEPFGLPLLELLRAPMKASPDSLSGQMEYIRRNWGEILPPDLLEAILTAFDIVKEEEREWWGTPGPPVVPEFDSSRGLTGAGYEYPEYEAFSPDADWMSNVVLMAKMVYVWLDQLTKQYGRPLNRLDEIPDEELDRLARWGFTGLWLIGLWERSPSSQKIKHMMGNHDAVASAYSLYDYVIAADLGGEAALENLRQRCARRGIRLSSDMVPNHTGIYSRWVQEHPDWFVQTDYPPYPNYRFSGVDLSYSSALTIQIEDGYWNHSDAAVVFRHQDNHTGRVRYIYHGNDGTSTPWNDTAQLNYLLPEVREAVIQTILHVARNFPIIRFDAAMTLAKKHFQRLWYPQPGGGGGVPSRAEHAMTREAFDAAFPKEFWREVVDRVAQEVPDTLLLAEAFWLMEGYFVRTLGMHRVYNSAFMNMLKMEENAKYRQTVKNVLEFNPEILKRFVNFMNNPDERTAVEQFGKEGKYFGACVLLVTMPGLPMFGHGQIEGYTEKYGMEYRRAYWNEVPDEHLVREHEWRIFPLMRRRWLFSGSANFVFYDFFAGDHVEENVFAYSNMAGGERGVVLYHNRWATTSGWIRTSTAIGVKGENGDTTLVRKTLGEALNINGDGRHYYRFRDYGSGLEYLRSGRDIHEKGLFAHLEGYEYQVFLDWREIFDDEYGNWGRLCWQLENRGVENLDEEFKLVQWATVLEPARKMFAATVPRLDLVFDSTASVTERQEIMEAYGTLLEEFLRAVPELATDPAEGAECAVRQLERLSALYLFSDPGKGGGEVLAYLQEVLREASNRLLLLAGISLAPLAEKDASAVADRFGLHRVAEEAYGAAGISFPWRGRDNQAVRVLLGFADLLPEWEEKGAESLRRLMEDPEAARFLNVHSSGGYSWFNREQFELLLRLLCAVCIARAACQEEAVPVNLSLEASLLHQVVKQLSAAAEKAGYRLDLFLKAIE
ncbi:MAG TPA: alpha-amylase family glycosyl hydrolase, partial [Verrucomicrobiae bacterium]|nr:alpha-amylase family glycosyl hydrolase [Verrucomicrobiae bacterium]